LYLIAVRPSVGRSRNFADRITVVKNLTLLPAPEADTVFETLDACRKVRNACAHPVGSGDVMPGFDNPKSLWQFIRDCHEALVCIEKLLPDSDAI
jgi:hypothetical protein